MADSAQQWELFGYDMRRLWQHWRWAWREFLWGDRSPLRARLDEVVRASDGDSWCWLHVGEEVQAREASCEAVLLPEEHTLCKTLTLPRAVEDDLGPAMALEVMSLSPFPPGDTASGWRVCDRGESSLTVGLCIVSRSATMRYLGRVCDVHEPEAREVWARVMGAPVMLRGFGEGQRLARYTARLRKVALMASAALLLLLAVLGVAAGSKYLEWRQYDVLSDSVQSRAANAVALRAKLAAASEAVSAVNDVVAEYPDPHLELAAITGLLGDGTYLSQFTMEGRELRLRGRAANAAGVIEDLTDNPRFESVSAPQGIVSIGTTGLEQFTIEVLLAQSGGQDQ